MVVDVIQQLCTMHEVSTQTESPGPTPYHESQPAKRAVELLGTISKDQLQVVSNFICKFADIHYGVKIDPDFLQLCFSASRYLKQCNRTNVVYGIAKAIGRMQLDGSDSRLPAKKMPMGLLEQMVNFFNADSYSEVKLL